MSSTTLPRQCSKQTVHSLAALKVWNWSNQWTLIWWRVRMKPKVRMKQPGVIMTINSGLKTFRSNLKNYKIKLRKLNKRFSLWTQSLSSSRKTLIVRLNRIWKSLIGWFSSWWVNKGCRSKWFRSVWTMLKRNCLKLRCSQLMIKLGNNNI